MFDFIQKSVQAHIENSTRKTVQNWDAKIRTYKKWFITALMVLAFVFLVLGMWKALLITYLIGHFHVMINENYWKIRTIEANLDKRNEH